MLSNFKTENIPYHFKPSNHGAFCPFSENIMCYQFNMWQKQSKIFKIRLALRMLTNSMTWQIFHCLLLILSKKLLLTYTILQSTSKNNLEFIPTWLLFMHKLDLKLCLWIFLMILFHTCSKSKISFKN